MSRRDINSIITVDIYNSKSYKLSNGKFTLINKLKRKKKDIVVSYISNRDLIIESVDLSNSIPKENLLDVITDKVYEELRLDPAIEYGIYPIKTALHLENTKYQVLIVDKNSFKNRLELISKKVKNIDIVIPSALLYKTLYQSGKINRDGTDMFIYFGDNDTFITFYHKGEYLYSKSIKFSVEQMYNRFCQLAQEVPISKEQFRELFENDCLRDLDCKYRELLVSIVNECFLNINDVLIYTKRAYDIQDIKIAYIGFSWGYITGIESYISSYLNLESKPLSSVYSSEDPMAAIDPMHTLMALSAQEVESGVLDLPNLTPYPKAKSISKRASGKMLLVSFFTILLFLLPIAYDYFVGFTTKASNLMLEKKEAKTTALANRYKMQLSSKQEELKALESAIDKIDKTYNNKQTELKNVYNKKFKYKLRSEQLALITEVIKSYDISSKYIDITDTLYKIEVESVDDKEITAFIKDLVKKFDKEISSVDIKEIVYSPKEGIYKGVVKIEFSKEDR